MRITIPFAKRIKNLFTILTVVMTREITISFAKRIKILFAILIVVMSWCIIEKISPLKVWKSIHHELTERKKWEKEWEFLRIKIDRKKIKLQEVKIILHKRGGQENLDNQSSYFPEVL